MMVQQQSGREILQHVDSDRREKFASRLKEYRGREWSRQTFIQDFLDVWNTIETTDELLSDVRSEKQQHSIEEKEKSIKEDVGTEYWDTLNDKTVKGGYRITFQALADERDTLLDLERREKAWKNYQFALASLAMQKLRQVAERYKDDLNSGEVVENVVEYVNNQLEDKVEARDERLLRRVENRMHQLERQLHGIDARDESPVELRQEEPETDELSDEERRERIIADLKEGELTQGEIAEQYGVTQQAVSNLKSKHIGSE